MSITSSARRPGIFVFFALWLIGGPAVAEIEAKTAIEDAQLQMQQFSARFRAQTLRVENADKVRKQASDYRRLARDCIVQHESVIAAITRDINTLKPASDAQNATIDAARDTLEQERAKHDEKLSSCKLLLVNSDALLDELDQMQEQALAERLTARSLNIVSLIIDGGREVDWVAALTSLELKQSGVAYLNPWRVSLLVALTSGLLAAGLFGQRRLRAILASRSAGEDMSGEAAAAFISAIARYMPAVLPLAAWSGFWVVVVGDMRPWPQLAVASFAITAYLLVALCGRALFSPPAPVRHYLPLDETRSKRFWQTLRWLALIAATGVALFQSPFIQGLSEPLLVLLRAAYAPLFIISLIWTIWLAFTLQTKGNVGLFRPLVTLVMIGGLIAEWSGYHNLADYIVGGIALSLVALGLAWLLNSLLTDIFDGLDEGRYRWQRRLRARLGLDSGEHIPGLVWLRVLTTVVTWGGLLLFLLRVWGLSAQGQDVLLRYFYEGFEVGPGFQESGDYRRCAVGGYRFWSAEYRQQFCIRIDFVIRATHSRR